MALAPTAERRTTFRSLRARYQTAIARPSALIATEGNSTGSPRAGSGWDAPSGEGARDGHREENHNGRGGDAWRAAHPLRIGQAVGMGRIGGERLGG
jgi:hypothetical protein